jgi:hypothetical protein
LSVLPLRYERHRKKQQHCAACIPPLFSSHRVPRAVCERSAAYHQGGARVVRLPLAFAIGRRHGDDPDEPGAA